MDQISNRFNIDIKRWADSEIVKSILTTVRDAEKKDTTEITVLTRFFLIRKDKNNKAWEITLVC